MTRAPAPSEDRIANEVARFSAPFVTAPLPSIRRPGLDPGSIPATLDEWIPDQVRDDDCLGSPAKIGIAREVAQFSGLAS